MIQLTYFKSPSELIDTQYGVVPVLKWLESEKVRIEQDPERRAEIRKSKRSKVALFVKPVVGCSCEECQGTKGE